MKLYIALIGIILSLSACDPASYTCIKNNTSTVIQCEFVTISDDNITFSINSGKIEDIEILGLGVQRLTFEEFMQRYKSINIFDNNNILIKTKAEFTSADYIVEYTLLSPSNTLIVK